MDAVTRAAGRVAAGLWLPRGSSCSLAGPLQGFTEEDTHWTAGSRVREELSLCGEGASPSPTPAPRHLPPGAPNTPLSLPASTPASGLHILVIFLTFKVFFFTLHL